MLINYFMGMLTLVFAIASVIAGIFTAYFGSGKSRAVGAILIVIGLVVLFVFMYGAGFLSFMGTPTSGSILSFGGTIVSGIAAVIGAVIGALIALGIFLLAIMKA